VHLAVMEQHGIERILSLILVLIASLELVVCRELRIVSHETCFPSACLVAPPRAVE
jgi:hypothetical protein